MDKTFLSLAYWLIGYKEGLVEEAKGNFIAYKTNMR